MLATVKIQKQPNPGRGFRFHKNWPEFHLPESCTLLQIQSSGQIEFTTPYLEVAWDNGMQEWRPPLTIANKCPKMHKNSQHFRTCAKRRIPRRVARMAAARPCSRPGADNLETIFTLVTIGPALLLLPLKLLEVANWQRLVCAQEAMLAIAMAPQPSLQSLLFSILSLSPSLRATSHTSQEPWPWKLWETKRRAQDSSKIMQCGHGPSSVLWSYMRWAPTIYYFNEFLFMLDPHTW